MTRHHFQVRITLAQRFKAEYGGWVEEIKEEMEFSFVKLAVRLLKECKRPQSEHLVKHRALK